MDYSKTAAGVLEGIGGKQNVQSLVHCATRLRFVLKDESKADTAAIKAVPGVITAISPGGGQYHIVIGNEVPEVFAEVNRLAGIEGPSGAAAPEQAKGNVFNRFIKMLSALFSPILWVLAGSGLLKALLTAAATFGWIDPTTTTYTVLNALSDSLIYFLPMALAITAARHFRANEFTSFTIAGAMLYPSIVALAGSPDVTLFGIPVTMVSYISSVIPIVVVVWLQGYVERFLLAKLPAAIRRFTVPMIVLVVFVPLAFLAIGPVSNTLSTAIGTGINWFFTTVPWLGGAIVGAFYQVMVIFGLHWGFVPFMVTELQTAGHITLLAPMFAAVLAQVGATLAVWIRTRNRALRSLAGPATLSGFLAGITEPAVYGVTLPLKRPFIFGSIGGAIGGAIIAAGGAASTAIVFTSLLSLPALASVGNFAVTLIGVGVAIVIGFVLTLVFGFKDPVDAATPPTDQSHANETPDVTVLSPLDGTIFPLSAVPDDAFADGSFGQGLAIRPRVGALYAPFDATVVAAFPTGHAVGLRSTKGAELLIHVGIDTVNLGGQHFELKVAANQQVRAGDLLVQFDVDAITAAGYDLITPVILTNSDEYPALGSVAAGEVEHGDELFVAVAAAPVSSS